MKSILSILIVILGVTALILSYQSGTNRAAANGYVSRGTIQGEKYYDISKEEVNDLEMANDNTDIYEQKVEVGEREVVSLKTAKIEITNRWNITLTDEEIDLLAKIVWLESQGEIDKGQQAVVEVIFNRMKHWEFKGSLYDVLSEKNAFSTWKNRSIANPTEKEYENIQKVLDGKTDITTENHVYFSTSPRNKKDVIKIGNHYFCSYEYDSKEDKE
jgi:N-acetylmuramoyl-L-alanine amidase